MRLKRIKIRNFRLLKDVSIDLVNDDPTTILVGSNNSGKTSVMDALRLFTELDSRRKLSLNDITFQHRRLFSRIEKYLNKAHNKERRVAILRRWSPRISIDLVFDYDETSEDMSVANELLMSLNPETNIITLRIEFSLENAIQLLHDFDNRRKKDESLDDFISDKLSIYYNTSFFKVSEDGKEIVGLDKGKGTIARRLIKIDIISAQRHIDDDESSKAEKLSKLLHSHYDQYYRSVEPEGFAAIEDAISNSTASLTQDYAKVFDRLMSRLKTFGYPPGQLPPNLMIRAEMNAESLYKDNTRIYYSNQFEDAKGNAETFELPEKYNGLGFKNLIFIVLQLEAFRAAFEAIPVDQPRVHLILIEEPEVHLHPQMQSVFIKEIKNAITNADDTSPQVLVSTHSSHIVADSGFEPIRYFKKVPNGIIVKDLSQLPLESSREDLKRFLLRYMQLTHCDIFFSDKVIFVEGQVERLLMPLMLEKISESFRGQYISVLEVGGAYAHVFQNLIDFIGIPTPVITDLDSVNTKGEKCKVAKGVKSSNIALANWIPKKDKLAELQSCTEDDKTQNKIRVAYQIPEINSYCGRSFEEAFVYANVEWLKSSFSRLVVTESLIKNAIDKDLILSAYDLSNKIPKLNFALDLITADDWNVPRYIAEGLEWLIQQGNP